MKSLGNEIIYGTIHDVERLIEMGADVNDVDEYGLTPLIEAAVCNKTDIAELLLQNDALVNAIDVVGNTALHWAVDNHNLPLCKLLLEHNADPNTYNRSGQPVLVKPLLRGHDRLKKLLYKYKADLDFAKDFINAKLIGHRYELRFDIHVVNPEGRFILVDFEGFYLESSIGIINYSLKLYKRNFAAKHLRSYFEYINKIIDALTVASELTSYQHYTLDVKNYENRIDELLDRDLLIIPATYQGHAITFIRYGNYFVKCDRGANSQFEASVMVYYIHNPRRLTLDLLKQIIYKKNSEDFMHKEVNKILGLTPIDSLPLPSQKSGNCSWANVEATVPSLIFLMLLDQVNHQDEIPEVKEIAMHFHEQWHEWDKDRALTECISRFNKTKSDANKASKAAIMAAILFQACNHNKPRDLTRAQKITSLLSSPPFDNAIRNYISIYYQKQRTPQGENLIKILSAVAPDKRDIWY